MSMIKLNSPDILPGSNVVIAAFEGCPIMCERLHELGLHQGSEVTILRRSPFKGPMLIRFKSAYLALRDEEAQCALISRQ